MADNVIQFPAGTRGDLDPDAMLTAIASDCARIYERVIVIGVTADGHTHLHQSAGSYDSAIGDLARAHLMAVTGSLPDDEDWPEGS